MVVDFYPEVKVHRDINNETYFTYGAHVLALPVAGVGTRTKSYQADGFYDLNFAPERLAIYEYAGEPVHQAGQGGSFQTRLLNTQKNKMESVKLVPMDKTILRQITFKTVERKKK